MKYKNDVDGFANGLLFIGNECLNLAFLFV